MKTNLILMLMLLMMVASGVRGLRNALRSGETLWALDWLISDNRKCEMLLQTDQNLLVFDREYRQILWQTGKAPSSTRRDGRLPPNRKRTVVLKLLDSGNLIKTFNDADYARGFDILWQTYTGQNLGVYPYKLELADDCRLFVRDAYNATIWRNALFYSRTEHDPSDADALIPGYEKDDLLAQSLSTSSANGAYSQADEYQEDEDEDA